MEDQLKVYYENLKEAATISENATESFIKIINRMDDFKNALETVRSQMIDGGREKDNLIINYIDLVLNKKLDSNGE